MELFLFYAAADGSGDVGELRGLSFNRHYSYAPRSFSPTWSAISELPLSGGRLLFYDSSDGFGVAGRLTPAGFGIEHVYEPGSLGAWTTVVPIRRKGRGRMLFYDGASGRVAVGFDPTVETYQPGHFARGWSSIVPSLSSERLFFYNRKTGAGAVGFDPSTRSYPPGSFRKTWSHIASAPAFDGEDVLFFYNATDRSGALGRLSSRGFRTVLTYAPASFDRWSHVVGCTRGFLCYDATSGAGALAVVRGEQIVMETTWPAGTFKVGCSMIVRSSNPIEGYAWPFSVKPGETVAFKVSADAERYQATFLSFRNADSATVDAKTIERSEEIVEVPVGGPVTHPGSVQAAPGNPRTGAAAWDVSFTLDVPGHWNSGLYAVRLVDNQGGCTYIPFVVRPPDDRRADFAVIVNVTTWNAHNAWGSHCRSEMPDGGGRLLSYHRPLADVMNPSRSDRSYQRASKHQGRGELWLINWLQQAGYDVDLHTDLDLHAGIAGLSRYKALVFSTHPEYLSTRMRDAVDTYLNQGGSLVYLGGNGFFDAVDIAVDGSCMTVHGAPGGRRTHLFRQPPLDRPESALLGIATPWSEASEDLGNNTGPRMAFRTDLSAHPFFDRTGLSDGETFGAQGWCVAEGARTLASGGASGWTCDSRDAHSPANVVLLAHGVNMGAGAEMVTYDHPGGGFVFSAGSMTIQGAIPCDPILQRIVSNVLQAARTSMSPPRRKPRRAVVAPR